jgi:hypothetical protein
MRGDVGNRLAFRRHHGKRFVLVNRVELLGYASSVLFGRSR